MEERGRVLGTCEPHEDTQRGYLGETFGDEDPADCWGAGVDGLVDEGWCPPEVAEVLDCDVLRIWTGGIEVW